MCLLDRSFTATLHTSLSLLFSLSLWPGQASLALNRIETIAAETAAAAAMAELACRSILAEQLVTQFAHKERERQIEKEREREQEEASQRYTSSVAHIMPASDFKFNFK